MTYYTVAKNLAVDTLIVAFALLLVAAWIPAQLLLPIWGGLVLIAMMIELIARFIVRGV